MFDRRKEEAPRAAEVEVADVTAEQIGASDGCKVFVHRRVLIEERLEFHRRKIERVDFWAVRIRVGEKLAPE
jgi:hypothetical protein